MQAGDNFDNGDGEDGFIIKGSSGCTHPSKYSVFDDEISSNTCQHYDWITTFSQTDLITKVNWVAESPDGTYFVIAGMEDDGTGN